jgi:hypothetical protein
MLYLQEIFNDLAYGEFADLAISNPLSGSSLPDHHPKLVSLLNAGLLALYSRFKIKEKEFDLYQREGKTRYLIRSAHLGDPNAGDPEIYLDGTIDDPPAGDIIRFLEAFDEEGSEYHINDPKYPLEAFTPEPDIIKMTPADPPKIISLVYQASYPKITIGEGFDPETYALYFPPILKRALLAHVASTVFVGKGTGDNGKGGMSSIFYYRYEQACLEIQKLGLLRDRDTESDRFDNNGWV